MNVYVAGLTGSAMAAPTLHFQCPECLRHLQQDMKEREQL